MAYEAYEWASGEDGGTPITADRLNHIENGIADIELTPGPEGPRGPAGSDGSEGDQGPQGDQGPAGADGSDAENPFTEDEVAALKALVEADGD